MEITHANLNHLVHWHRETFRVTGRIVQVISLVLGSTRLSWKYGRIFAPGRLCVS